MSGQTEYYAGYVNTNFIRDKAGLREEQRVLDSEINVAIKAAEEHVNDNTNLTWFPYAPYELDPTKVPPNRIKEATKFFAIAMLRNVYPDENDTYDKNWKLGTILLESYIKSNATAQQATSGDTVLSDYNADTLNEDVAPDLTTKTFNRDYLPTFRS